MLKMAFVSKFFEQQVQLCFLSFYLSIHSHTHYFVYFIPHTSPTPKPTKKAFCIFTLSKNIT